VNPFMAPLASRGVNRTEIVLAVVQCGGHICLARRTELVGTSRGLWSVVMGYVEPGVEPTEQAWTEIREELGLQPPDVWLLRSGPSLPLTSRATGKQFLVYSFLFDSPEETEVTLNWEHSAVAWVEPSRLSDPDCVPWQRDLVMALLAGAE
jgi:8-oxo-dGTP diphosphatase